MIKPKQVNTIAILMPGDMGHGCALAFQQNGLRVVTCLAGRSQRTRNLAKKAGLEIIPSLNTLVETADLILSILPPEYAVEQAIHVAAAMKAVDTYPDYVDCNAISPATAKKAAATFDGLVAKFCRRGHYWVKPGKRGRIDSTICQWRRNRPRAPT